MVIALVSGNTYRIGAKCSGRHLNVVAKSTAASAQVAQNQYFNEEHQQFVLTDVGGGYWSITAVHSSKCLEVQNASTSSGAYVVQNTYTGAAHQKWTIEDIGFDCFKIGNVNSGMTMNINGGGTGEGVLLNQGAWTHDVRQMFYVEDISTGVYQYSRIRWANAIAPAMSTPTPPATCAFNGVLYQVVRDSSNNLVLSSFDGAAWTAVGNISTVWAKSTMSVALCVYDDVMQMIYRDVATTSFRRATMQTNGTWTDYGVINSTWCKGSVMPCVCVYNNLMYIFYRDAAGNAGGWGSFDAATQTWTGRGWISLTWCRTSLGFSAVVYNNELKLAYRDYNGTCIGIGTYNSGTNTWTSNGWINTAGSNWCSTGAVPVMAVYDNKIHLVWRNSGSGLVGLCLAVFNGTRWAPYVFWQVDTFLSSYVPSMAVFQGRIHMTYMYKTTTALWHTDYVADELEVSNDDKIAIMTQFAPRIWLQSTESWYPSTVEFSFDYMTRYQNSADSNNYCIKSTTPLSEPSSTLEYFHGMSTLADVPMYSYWNYLKNGMVAIHYFLYFPYNRGKEIVDTIWGSHQGDWERVSVFVQLDGATATASATHFVTEAHGTNSNYVWADVTKVAGTSHPIAYCAEDSHAIWLTSGSHNYATGVPNDICDAGEAWDGWNNLVAFDFGRTEGLDAYAWPAWMSRDFTVSTGSPDSLPSNGPIHKWGCEHMGIQMFGEYQLNDGCTGPISKSLWTQTTL
jgi:hypothetical protein